MLADHFSKIGSKAVRTAGTIAGNLILGTSRTGSFHSDILPIFTLLEAEYSYLQTETYGDLKLHGVMKELKSIEADNQGILYQIKIRIPQSTDHVFLRKIINRSGLSLSNYSVCGFGDRDMVKVRDALCKDHIAQGPTESGLCIPGEGYILWYVNEEWAEDSGNQSFRFCSCIRYQTDTNF